MTSTSELAAKTFIVNDIADSLPAKRRGDDIDDLDLPANFDTSRRGAEIKALSLPMGGASDIDSFLDSSVAMDVVRQTADSMPSLVEMLSICADFLRFNPRTLFPTDLGSNQMAGASSIHGATLSIYNPLNPGLSDSRLRHLAGERGDEAIIMGLKQARVCDNNFDTFEIRVIFV